MSHLTKRVVDLDGVETSEELHFFYDAQSRPAFVEHEGIMYRYIHNLQGDIVAIVDSIGKPVVEYKYDAWGKPLDGEPQTGIGKINPYRYRSYVWDEEESCYYLASRYYEPCYNRFINADDDSYLGENGDLTGYNLIAYCKNSPVGYFDEEGTAFETVFDIISLAVSAVEVISNPTDLTAWAGLLGDTVDLIPFVTGVGETIRTLRTADKIVDGADTVIDSYGHLRKINKGTGLEAHHIVEKRFAEDLGYSKSGYKMPSIILPPDKHQIYTNKWRKLAPYKKEFNYDTIIRAAANIYNTEPELLGAAIYTMIKSTVDGR